MTAHCAECPPGAAIQRTNVSKRCNPMCDYSLHATASRPAKAGDKLISTSFSRTSTRGFAAETDRNVAVCLMPGTELGFAENVKYNRNWFWRANTGFSVARFRKIEASSHQPHQDALEFPDGKVVLLTALVPGQRARVLQLPAKVNAALTSEASRSAAVEPETMP
jgi:hypothetical protein